MLMAITNIVDELEIDTFVSPISLCVLLYYRIVK